MQEQKSTPNTQLLCNPGVVLEKRTCIYASAAVNCFRGKLTNLRRHAPRIKPGLHKAADVTRDSHYRRFIS